MVAPPGGWNKPAGTASKSQSTVPWRSSRGTSHSWTHRLQNVGAWCCSLWQLAIAACGRAWPTCAVGVAAARAQRQPRPRSGRRTAAREACRKSQCPPTCQALRSGSSRRYIFFFAEARPSQRTRQTAREVARRIPAAARGGAQARHGPTVLLQRCHAETPLTVKVMVPFTEKRRNEVVARAGTSSSAKGAAS